MLVTFGRRSMCVRRGNQHVMTGGAQPSAQPFDVDFSATDAVGKIPAKQVRDFHRCFKLAPRRVVCQPLTNGAAAADSVTSRVDPRRRAGERLQPEQSSPRARAATHPAPA